MKLLLLLTVWGIVLASLGEVRGQLLLPTQVCEMECLKNIGAPEFLTYADPRAQRCRSYCLVHAYDNLLPSTTTETTESD